MDVVEGPSKTTSLFRSDRFAAPMACVLFGVLISVMPHLVWLLRSGSPVWIADNDEFLYLSYASQAYFNHPASLSDPVLSSHAPTMYPWLQLAPGILPATLLQLGPMAISVIWRAWAGVSIALGWYLLVKFHVKKPWSAAAISAVLLADVGVVAAHPIWRQAVAALQVLLGRTQGLLDKNPQLHQEWRIVTPALSLMYLLFHIWLVVRAREIPSRSRILLAGLGLGVLFYEYFFFWTAACLALAAVFLLDAKNRKVYWQTTVIGVVVGLPSLLATFLLKKSTLPDWLPRTDYAVPIPRLSELLIPKIAIFLLIVLFIWVWRRRRDLIYVWALAASALLLMDHQILTRLQMQNFHWTYVWGPCLSMLILLALVDGLGRVMSSGRLVRLVIGVLLIAHLSTGLWLRAVEAAKSQESVEFTTTYGRYHEQHNATHLPFMPNAVMAGDKDFVNLAVILDNLRPLDHYAVIMSPSIDNSEWDARVALNGFLLGLDREAFGAKQREVLNNNVLGPEARDPARRAERLDNRLKIYDQIASNPRPALDRFQVKYVALAKDVPPPSYLAANWRRLADGPYWQVWERRQ